MRPIQDRNTETVVTLLVLCYETMRAYESALTGYGFLRGNDALASDLIQTVLDHAGYGEDARQIILKTMGSYTKTLRATPAHKPRKSRTGR